MSSTDEISVAKRFALDARMKLAASAQGFDSILLMSPSGWARFKATGKIPLSLELNILNP